MCVCLWRDCTALKSVTVSGSFGKITNMTFSSSFSLQQIFSPVFLILSLHFSRRNKINNSIFFPISMSLCVQVLSSQCWRSCCLSPQNRTTPAGWLLRRRTAVPTKCENWCRNILTRLVQHSFSLLQSTACSKTLLPPQRQDSEWRD